MRSLLWRYRVVEHDLDRHVGGNETEVLHEQPPPKVVRTPRAAREESVEPLMMSPSRDVGRDERLRDRVRATAEHPANEDDNSVRVPRSRERGLKHFQPAQERAKSVVGHGPSDR